MPANKQISTSDRCYFADLFALFIFVLLKKLRYHLFFFQDKWAKTLETLDLNMDEVIHIRSVLTKAEMEGLPLDGTLKASFVISLMDWLDEGSVTPS